MVFHLPDRFFSRITDIDAKNDILDIGIDNILLDIDNTILPRDSKRIPVDIKRWVEQLKSLDIKICLVSNDWHSYVLDVAEELNLPIVTKSLKPLPVSFMRALGKIKAKKKNTLMIGDQLMTDVFGAHLIGMKCYLVLPLAKKDLKHTLILRKVERIFLGNKKPEPARIGE